MLVRASKHGLRRLPAFQLVGLWPDTSSLRFWGWFQVSIISSVPSSAAPRAWRVSEEANTPRRLPLLSCTTATPLRISTSATTTPIAMEIAPLSVCGCCESSRISNCWLHSRRDCGCCRLRFKEVVRIPNLLSDLRD